MLTFHEAKATDVDCSKCGAKAGEPCIPPFGLLETMYHMRRANDALEQAFKRGPSRVERV